MAETQPKRHREEPQAVDFEEENPSTKRQKPYNPILSLLEEEEDETEPAPEPPSEDLSAMFTTLQQELSSSTSCDSTAFEDFDFLPCTAVEVEVAELASPHHHQQSSETSTSAVCSPRSGHGDGDGGDDGAKSVMRHLLEASDDELGIPNREDDGVVELKSGENFPFAFSDHGLWELEDEAANYYTVLQSELFM
ncbi:hypothetical protein F511_25904 [Dorcoceras hygrometricum]|uniref:Uncharacterized protein n=1 Tax=Dorcoceras hygrometricum TaxID=472368 RepID=A0A2Z7AAW5_9LAMI|nr:hypothetical protein F511_25904 [Dorcoceras hygrometricum]